MLRLLFFCLWRALAVCLSSVLALFGAGLMFGCETIPAWEKIAVTLKELRDEGRTVDPTRVRERGADGKFKWHDGELPPARTHVLTRTRTHTHAYTRASARARTKNSRTQGPRQRAHTSCRAAWPRLTCLPACPPARPGLARSDPGRGEG